MKLGSKLVYPMHGAGEIIDIAEKDFFGKDMLFCTLKIAQKDMVLKFPISKAEGLNIRPVSDIKTILETLKTLESEEYIKSSNWNKRYQTTLNKMKLGTVEDISSVLVNLKTLETIKGLSSGERQLYHSAFDILSSEIMLINGGDIEDANKLLEEELEEVARCVDMQE